MLHAEGIVCFLPVEPAVRVRPRAEEGDLLVGGALASEAQ
jgi:hypothetical protein